MKIDTDTISGMMQVYPKQKIPRAINTILANCLRKR